MQVELLSWLPNTGWQGNPKQNDADLVLYFMGKNAIGSDDVYKDLKNFYPKAHILGCTTGGEIYGAEVLDDSVSCAAVKFKNVTIAVASTSVSGNEDSHAAGQRLAKELNQPNLHYVLVLSDGTNVNGSDLVNGLYSVLDESVIVTGGLAGDGADFKKTLVGLNAPPKEKNIVAVGFRGQKLKITYGSVGGWNTIGPQRHITKSKDNILYELDGKPALDLYKQYLGDDAARLPGSALLFPLSIKPNENSEHDIVRTIVGIDEDQKAMIFAGDIPDGYLAQLMHGDFNNLIDGAVQAANLAHTHSDDSHSLALLVSCIGRKLLMGQQISEETEAVAEVFGNKVPIVGFYSYGEICHQQFTNKCSLHNQTMTITLIQEDE